MSMLDHIHEFARRIAEDGHGYGRHKGDLTMTLPERQWMGLVAECAARANYGCTDVPRSMYEPITLSHGYGFNVIVSGPKRPDFNYPATAACEHGQGPNGQFIARLKGAVDSPIPTTQPGGDTGCAFKCMDCGAAVLDLGPMKTSYYCQACIDLRNAKRDCASGGEGFFLEIPAQRTFEVLPIPYHNVIWSKLPCGCMPPCTKNHSEFT